MNQIQMADAIIKIYEKMTDFYELFVEKIQREHPSFFYAEKIT